MHVTDPDSLTDCEWAACFNELVWIREKEMKGQQDKLKRIR